MFIWGQQKTAQLSNSAEFLVHTSPFSFVLRVFHECLCTVCMKYPHKPGEGARSPGTDVTDCCAPSGCRELNLDPLEKLCPNDTMITTVFGFQVALISSSNKNHWSQNLWQVYPINILFKYLQCFDLKFHVSITNVTWKEAYKWLNSKETVNTGLGVSSLNDVFLIFKLESQMFSLGHREFSPTLLCWEWSLGPWTS